MERVLGIETWLYDNLPVGVAILDGTLTYRYANHAFAAIHGETIKGMSGHPLSAGQPEWVALVSRMIAQVRESGSPADAYNVTLYYLLQPSKQRTWDVTVLPVAVEGEADCFVIYLHDVTDRQRAERLSVSESRLRSVLEVAVDAVIVIDQDGTILQVNPAALRMFGYTEEEMVGQSGGNIMPEQLRNDHFRGLKRYQHTGLPHVVGTIYETTGLRKDGSIFPCELSVAESAEGSRLRIFVGIIRDVSERKHVEQELRDEGEFIAAILDTIGALVIVLNTEGEIERINRAFTEVTGYTLDELKGKIIWETVLPGEEVQHVKEIFHELVTGSYPNAYENFLVAKTGERRLVSWTNTTLPDAEGRVAYIIGTGIDVTERRLAEDELRDARARLEAILNTVALPLYVVNRAGRVTLYNEAARQFYGEYITENNMKSVVRLNARTRARITFGEWTVCRSLRESRTISGVEEIVVFPDGREVPVLVYSAPVIVDDRVVAAVGVNQDITQLKAADRAKDEFLALITHELKSPLATIISWADLAAKEPEFAGEALPIILRNARAQERIVNDLLDLSRIRYGKFSLEKAAVDAWEVAVHTVEGRLVSIEEHQLSLEWRPPGEALPVWADPVRLAQVIDNLLTNAIKFTPAGGAITLAGLREDGWTRLSVSDTGRGIPPEQLPLIFQQFQQLGRERVSGGLGLGLALVKGIVELHGGRVAAESAGLDKGATFTVWLPLRTDS